MAAPSPGAGLTEGLQNGPASNRFARELAHRDSISTLTGYILHDFEAGQPLVKPLGSDSADSNTPHLAELPNGHSATSSVIHSISVIIELIRKNNSDYFEPYLFHTLRNRLIQVQQQLQGADNARETLEAAMKEMVDRMGVVNLGPLLDAMCERLSDFQRFLLQPRSLVCSSWLLYDDWLIFSPCSKGLCQLLWVSFDPSHSSGIEFASYTLNSCTVRTCLF